MGGAGGAFLRIKARSTPAICMGLCGEDWVQRPGRGARHPRQGQAQGEEGAAGAPLQCLNLAP